ncbi:phosphoribosylamine--glycine ligase [Inquilinus sp. CAU 1745]|uniref:phosphoribosylamine--glycine ligase n=1 Tax=Inquilinus sp. CAU 1745 TaxID=3140369 RepID=UPI00325A7BC8
MNILVVGSGGREHALCWAIEASPLCDRLYCAPGNAGIAAVAECLPVAADDVEGLVVLASEKAIDFVVVGPEQPLVLGLVDRLAAAGVKAFGPSASAAALEGSKSFMKGLCARYGIPTARYATFTDAEAAKAHVRAEGAPIVVKADGLAAGKGVVVAAGVEEAEAAIDAALLEGSFGEAGAEIIVEECMTGPELSFFVLADGETVLPLAGAQDHKRAYDNDEGPNTGGMGAFSPSPLLTDALRRRVMAEIIEPTVAAMKAEGAPFKGVLYAGLMLTPDGPKLLEYNVRFGDPECQALMVRLKSDILPALIASADGALSTVDLRWRDEAAIVVVMASKGYPGAYRKGTPIKGLKKAGETGATIFHAGTASTDDGGIVATGGRVLGVTALGATLGEARDAAYRAVDAIDWPEGFCRRDIAAAALSAARAEEGA